MGRYGCCGAPTIATRESTGKMDIRNYYERIRAHEVSISAEYTWIATLATKNGGVEGRISEVARRTAARMLVDGTARLATDDEVSAELGRQQAQGRRAAEVHCPSYVVAREPDASRRAD